MTENIKTALSNRPETDKLRKKRIAESLEEPDRASRELAEKLGLNPYPVNWWIVDNDEMNELIAYGGFQKRYPHWRWGMQYEKQKKQDQFLGGKAFEIVNNDNPSHAFLQESNTLADQKAVMTHVWGHADFFRNNEWFGLFRDEPDATDMLARHSNIIEEHMQDPEVDREEVEKFIDHLLTLEDNIDQHREYIPSDEMDFTPAELGEDEIELDELELTEEVQEQVFDEEWLEDQSIDENDLTVPSDAEEDILGVLYNFGKQYDRENEKAVEFEDWQKDIIEIIRKESYYFAPQKMTRIMNEGWASYWESKMMTGENFAGDNEFITYSDHMARVLGSDGFNPYKLGLEMWQYVENSANRSEVVDKLLRIEGVDHTNFKDEIDFEEVREELAPPEEIESIDSSSLEDLARAVEEQRIDEEYIDIGNLAGALEAEVDADKYPWKVLTYEGLARRHYSLVQPQNRSFLENISLEELETQDRLIFDDDRYETVEEAISEVDFTAGWDRMFEVRQNKNDVGFIEEYLTQEFVEEAGYASYDYSHQKDDFRVSSQDVEDIRKKLLLQTTNMGKPTVTVEDINYENQAELLLEHQYNGVKLDIGQAEDVMVRMFELWGRPVNLRTILKQYDEEDEELKEEGYELRYDGENFQPTRLDWSEVEHLAATEIDYDTKPEGWV